VKRQNKGTLKDIKKSLEEKPPVFTLEEELPTAQYLIDKKKIASQMRAAAKALEREGKVIPHLNEAEYKTYQYLITQADRLDSLAVAGFDEANNMRQYVDTLIPYKKDGSVDLSEVQIKALQKLRTNIKEEIDSKMRKVFTESNPDWLPPPPRDMAIIPGSAEAEILTKNAIAAGEAGGMVDEWANFNKMYGVMAILAEGSNQKALKIMSDRLTMRNPWLWGTVAGIGMGQINSHAIQYLTGAIALNIMNTFGTQLTAQLGKSVKAQAAFRRSAAATERSMSEAVDSFFSPKKLAFKTVRYQAYLAGRPDLED
jgi:hypothetical protein